MGHSQWVGARFATIAALAQADGCRDKVFEAKSMKGFGGSNGAIVATISWRIFSLLQIRMQT
jgi:hypothetical protein